MTQTLAPDRAVALPRIDALFQDTFDVDFYLSQPGAVLGPDQSAANHFLTTGWRLGLSPNRWFDMLGYLADNPAVGQMGINPYLHYLEFGLEAGRRPMPFFRDHRWINPDLQRFGRPEYGPVRHILRYRDVGRSGPAFRGRLVVHLHLFYPDMIDAMATLLARLPIGFELLVSARDGVDCDRIAAWLGAALPQARSVTVRAGANRGRDVAPWLVTFRNEVRGADLFLHLHTKKSGHGSYHREWFDFLGHTLLGSGAVARQMLDLFAANPDLGMVAPGYWPMLRRAPNFGKTKDLVDHLCARIGARQAYPICPDFPAGSFFCCRGAVLTPLLDLELDHSDFPQEAGQICGTLAHALERMLGIVTHEAGQRFDMIAVDVPYDQAAQVPLVVPARRGVMPVAGPFRASVVMVVQDQINGLIDSVHSVLDQTQRPAELIIVADGAPDAVLAMLTDRFSADIARGRMRLIALDAVGPGAARNAALDEVLGDLVAYLVPGALWSPDHLALIAAAFRAHPEATSLTSNLVIRDADGGTRARRQSYDRAGLVAEDTIDLGGFVHRRDLIDRGLRFDPALADGAAWDFVLRATAHHAPLYLDHAGCVQPADATPTQTLVPAAIASDRVSGRHRLERLFWGQDCLQIAIKVPAPKHLFKHRWGDFHLAHALARGFERLGCRARVDIMPDWYGPETARDDVTFCLRGITPYQPRPEHINLMWQISHPTKVDLDEMRRFDHVFVGSYKYADRVVRHLGMQATNMLQCADPALFHDQINLDGVPHHDLLFVGNSRKVARWMPSACVARDLPIAIYGAEWGGLIPDRYVRGTHVPNDRLAAYYRASKIVLNDHWPDMAREGFVSNRIMDAGLAGALVISDHFDGEEIFMGHVVTCDSPQEVEDAVRYYLANESERRAKAEALRQLVLTHHTVEHRAAQVLQTIRGLVSDRTRDLG